MSASDAIPVPRKNTAFRLTFPVYDTAGALKSSLASADSEISLDGAAFADCTNEVTEIGSTGFYYIDLTSGEMNADTVAYKLSGTGINPLTAVLYPEEAGDYRGSVTSIAAGAITAAAIDTGAIDADALASDAVTEIQSGLATAAALATVDTVVDGIQTDLSNGTDGLGAIKADTAAILVDTAVIGAAGAGLTAIPWNASWDAEVQSEVTDALAVYDPPTKAELDSGLAALNDLDTAGVATAVWNAATATYGSAGSYGLLVETNLDAAVSGATAPTAAAVADAVWDEALSGHLSAGSTGEALNAAGAAGDPWTTTLPGAYTGSQAGKMLFDIITDTAEIGAAGAGLTAVPWNASWDAEVQSEVTDALTAASIPTATENADALLNRDMSAVTDSNARTPLNAFRFLRNKYSISGTTLTVTKEDDATSAWTAVLTTSAGADPVVGSDPA